jgi:large subunit ribosomal protein L3
VAKPQKGSFDKAGVSYKRYVREFKFEDAESYAVAQEIKADVFAAGDKIDATAISKGKGFQGAIKRHGQSRGPMAHGSKYHRHAGSNGACSDPSKVFKGKRMPGRMGGKQITIQNLEVIRVDAENNLILVKGAVPGPKKALVTIKETVKSGK